MAKADAARWRQDSTPPAAPHTSFLRRHGLLIVGQVVIVLLCVAACMVAIGGGRSPSPGAPASAHVGGAAHTPMRVPEAVPKATTTSPPAEAPTTAPVSTSPSTAPAPATPLPAVPSTTTSTTPQSGQRADALSGGTTVGPVSLSTASAVAQAVDPAVVDLAVIRQGGAGDTGTGLILTGTGEVLTNDHVVFDAQQITATDNDTGAVFAATVVGTDEAEDLAVLQLVGASDLPTARLAPTNFLTIGESVIAVGNANGTGGAPSFAGGEIVALGYKAVEQDPTDGFAATLSGLIETDDDILPGDSGGPLADDQGEVVGIDTARLQGATGGVAIPIGEAVQVANEIVDQAGWS